MSGRHSEASVSLSLKRDLPIWEVSTCRVGPRNVWGADVEAIRIPEDARRKLVDPVLAGGATSHVYPQNSS